MRGVLLALIPALASLGLAAGFLPIIRRLADRYGWYDPPDYRKIHAGNISQLGGVAIAGSFCLVVIVAGAVLSLYSTRLAFLLLGGFTLHVIGLVDDFKNLRAFPRLVAHVVIAGIVASGGFLMREITVPGLGTLALGWAAYPVTILWIAGVVNAMNWSDGMDGYAGGISAFAVLGAGVLGLLDGEVITVVLSFALLGAIVGFLLSNFPPARIFMGDNGATFIGFVLAVLPFVEESGSHSGARMTAMALLLILPLLDFVTSILRRVAGGRSPGSPDRGHIHHRLQDLGLRPRRVLAVIYPICAFLGLVAVVVARPPAWMPEVMVIGAFAATLAVGLVLAAFLSNPQGFPSGTRELPRSREQRRAG